MGLDYQATALAGSHEAKCGRRIIHMQATDSRLGAKTAKDSEVRLRKLSLPPDAPRSRDAGSPKQSWAPRF